MDAAGLSAKHPIQVVARRTGLSADVIRAWEKRYEAVSPARSSSRQRLFSDADVQRLTLLRQVTQAGRRIGDVAALSLDELQELARADAESIQTSQPRRQAARGPSTSARPHVEACLDAVRRLSARDLDIALASAATGLSTPVMLEDVVCNVMNEVGDAWHRGELRLCHEHLASAAVRSFLGGKATIGNMTGDGPTLVVTTPVGQGHELGALVSAVVAAASGWSILYLGQRMPAEEIAYAAAHSRARAVALGITYPADDPWLPDELRRLATQLPAKTTLIAGGHAAGGYSDVLDQIGARTVTNLESLQRVLRDLRTT